MDEVKREIVFKERDWFKMTNHLYEDEINETVVMAFCKLVQTDSLFRMLVKQLLFPRDSDYYKRTPTFAGLRPEFMERCFRIAETNSMHIIDIHDHPFSDDVSFSPADDFADGKQKGPYIVKYVPGVEMAFMVHGIDAEDLDARIWDRKSNSLKPLGLVKIL